MRERTIYREEQMTFGDFGSIEMQMLWLSAALGIVQLVLVVVSSGLAGRTNWALGARDEAGPPFGKVGARLDRALSNFVQTFAVFAAAVLMAHTLNKHSQISELGAQIYFWARVAYVPLYGAGIPVVRTLVWTVGVAGIVMVMLAIYPGM
jgi:uncharacterized MAPEG superfamily protein